MNDTDLIEIWQKSSAVKAKIKQQSPKLLSNMDKELAKFENRIKRRDRREIIVAIAVTPFLALGALTSDSRYEQIGCLLLILYVLWVIFALVQVKYKQPAFSVSLSLKAQLIEYQAYVLRQQKLVKNVLYWYLSPMLPGVFFMWMGLENTVVLVGSILFLPFVFIFVYQTNQRAAKENYTFLLEELSGAIAKLEGKEQG